MHRIINSVVQSSTFFSLNCPSRNQITHVNHIAQLADIPACLHPLEEILRLLVEHIESVPCTFQSQVTSYDSHVVGHYLAHLLHALRNEHLLLVGECAIVVPLGHLLVEVIQINMLQ